MKIFSGKKLLLCVATILTGTLAGTASANNTIDLSGLTGLSKSSNEHGVSYTAHGKTDMRTAKMFKQLMENNRNLQIHAEVGSVKKRPSQLTQSKKQQVEVSVNYTIRGKTNMKTVRKFIKLFQNNRHIEVTANISKKSRTNKQLVRSQNRYSQPVNTRYQPVPAHYYGYMPSYAPVYAYGYNNQYVWVPTAVAWGQPVYAYQLPQPQYNQLAQLGTTNPLVLASN